MFSVVIPTYNRKKSLIETLKAFSRQTFKDFEVVIIDDGSSDGTKEAIDKSNFSFKIRYFLQENKGPAAARNRGIGEARNKIIFLLTLISSPARNYWQSILKAIKKAEKI